MNKVIVRRWVAVLALVAAVWAVIGIVAWSGGDGSTERPPAEAAAPATDTGTLRPTSAPEHPVAKDRQAADGPSPRSSSSRSTGKEEADFDGQRPGTVRLAHGGTASLVREKVTDGVLPVPDGVDEATWWGNGLDAPKGATVLAGHVNWKGAVGPFEELWRSKRGDRVSVVDDDGQRFRYDVSKVLTIDKNDLPKRAASLFGQDGAHRLVLVTCGGRWVGGDDGYRTNRVVVAEQHK